MGASRRGWKVWALPARTGLWIVFGTLRLVMGLVHLAKMHAQGRAMGWGQFGMIVFWIAVLVFWIAVGWTEWKTRRSARKVL